MNRRGINYIVLFILMAIMCFSCNRQVGEIDKDEKSELHENLVIAVVTPDYYDTYTRDKELVKKEMEKFISALGMFDSCNGISIEYLTCGLNPKECELDSIMEWIDGNSNKKIIMLFNIQFPIGVLSEKNIDELNSKGVVVGIVGVNYESYNDNKQLGGLPENLSFNIINNNDESFGKQTAMDIARKVNGKEGYIILNRMPTSGFSGAVYYQESFIREFKKLKNKYDLSNISLHYDDEFIYSDDESKVKLISEQDKLLAIVDDHSADADLKWSSILGKAGVDGVSIYSFKESEDDIEKISDKNDYVYFKTPYETSIKAAIDTAISIANGDSFKRVQYIDCSRIS